MTTILCIEDDQLLRAELVEELEDAGYNVLQAMDGCKGFEMIVKHKPNLVVCDVTMPGGDGHAILRKIRAENQFGRMPFVFLSSSGERENVIAGLKLGADDYLSKPVDFDLFLVVVENAPARVNRIIDPGSQKRRLTA